MRHVHAICLDLDDTLWEVQPVIEQAEETLDGWIGERYPAVADEFDADDLRRIRVEVAADHPDRRHDLSFLRRAALRRIAGASGSPETFVSEAFAVFLSARNDVTLFDDVVPALTILSDSYTLFALSNGNADLGVIGLAGFFEAAYSARELGVAKPDPRIFRLLASRAGVPEPNIMHVGDDPQNDIVAAGEVGMTTVWVNRAARDWSERMAPPDHEVPDLAALVDLLQL